MTLYRSHSCNIQYEIIHRNGKIDHLINAWQIEYFQDTRPMDVLLIAGLNNVVKGWKPDEILREYDYLV